VDYTRVVGLAIAFVCMLLAILAVAAIVATALWVFGILSVR
jgi:hypothetical protein